MNKITSIKEVKALCQDHWFDPSTMRWHGTRLSSEVHDIGDAVLFVSSDADSMRPTRPRFYTVRIFRKKTGLVDTYEKNEYDEFKSLAAAKRAMRKWAKLYEQIASLQLNMERINKPGDMRLVSLSCNEKLIEMMAKSIDNKPTHLELCEFIEILILQKTKLGKNNE